MCATEYSLAKYCGVTFARIKPASLFTITEENSEKVRLLSGKFRSKGFVFVLMRSRNCRTLVFIYNKDRFEKIGAKNLYEKVSDMEKYSFGSKNSPVDMPLLSVNHFLHNGFVFINDFGCSAGSYFLSDNRGEDFSRKTAKKHAGN